MTDSFFILSLPSGLAFLSSIFRFGCANLPPPPHTRTFSCSAGLWLSDERVKWQRVGSSPPPPLTVFCPPFSLRLRVDAQTTGLGAEITTRTPKWASHRPSHSYRALLPKALCHLSGSPLSSTSRQPARSGGSSQMAGRRGQ